MFEVTWSGKFPTLCKGKWTIIKNGVDVSNFIPEALLCMPMGAYGHYSKWYFVTWHDIWGDYWDGLPQDEWIQENFFWIKKFCDNRQEMEELFQAIQEKDWRFGSCGGCIQK
jgi:hypothetical protein